MKAIFLVAAMCIPFGASSADLTFEAAATACKQIYQRAENFTDDGAKTFPSDDRVNVALTTQGVAIVCSVDKASGEVEEARGASGKTITKEQLRQSMARRAAREAENAKIVGGDHADFVRQAKAKITANFKDPSSAQFRNLYLSGKGLPTLCGEVNAKNSYGAYVGFRGFIYSETSMLLDDGKELGEQFIYRQMLPGSCGEKFADVE